MKRTFVVLRIVAVLLMGVGLMWSAPSMATAASCSNGGCNGKEPESQGCNSGTKTLATITKKEMYEGKATGQITAELRWTSACGHVAWVRVQERSRTVGADPRFMIQSCSGESCNNSNWHLYGTQFCTDRNNDAYCTDNVDYPFWGAMVGTGGRLVRICGEDADLSGMTYSYKPQTCSAWF